MSISATSRNTCEQLTNDSQQTHYWLATPFVNAWKQHHSSVVWVPKQPVSQAEDCDLRLLCGRSILCRRTMLNNLHRQQTSHHHITITSQDWFWPEGFLQLSLHLFLALHCSDDDGAQFLYEYSFPCAHVLHNQSTYQHKHKCRFYSKGRCDLDFKSEKQSQVPHPSAWK